MELTFAHTSSPILALLAPVVEQSEQIDRGNTHLIFLIMLGMEIDLVFLVVLRFKDDSAHTFSWCLGKGMYVRCASKAMKQWLLFTYLAALDGYSFGSSSVAC
ncbi:hypothetical protein VPH35_007803 [Triticum aestivum]